MQISARYMYVCIKNYNGVKIYVCTVEEVYKISATGKKHAIYIIQYIYSAFISIYFTLLGILEMCVFK